MRKGKRILILLGYGELGGAERQAIYLAEGLREHGHSISVLNFGPPGLSNRILDQKAIPNSSVTLKLGRKRKDLRRDLRKLYFRILPARPHVIIPFTRSPNVYANALSGLLPFTRIAWNQRDEGRELHQERVEKFAIKKAFRIISNSTPGKQFLVNNFGLSPDRVTIVRNGVQLPPETNEFTGALTVGMIGNLHGSKDHKTLIEGWALFKKQHLANDLRLLIAGRDDGLLSPLSALARELNVSDSVQFRGQVKDIHAFIRELHIGIHSSLQEGCPNAILEMMSHGLPVIANDIPGNKDALGAGYPLYFQTGNSEDLATRLSVLMNNRALALSAGVQNRERAASYFSIGQMVDGYRGLLGL